MAMVWTTRRLAVPVLLLVYAILCVVWMEPLVTRHQKQQGTAPYLDGFVPSTKPMRHLSNTTLAHKKQQQQRIAYVVTVTGCGSFSEGAAVLAHSIHQHSVPDKYGTYEYQLYAIAHPVAVNCTNVLKELGYKVLVRDVPVKVEDIQGEILRSRIEKNGCCGEKELLKFEAWTLVQHEIVVLLDLDVLVLKPLDRLFDYILNASGKPLRRDDLLWRGENQTILPDHVNLLYTTDYAMVSPERNIKPTQGGFVIFRPSMDIYKEFVEIIRKGDFREDGGWGGKTGKFWGCMTFQGLVPYYFQVLHPGTSVELNWCVWDNMCSPSRTNGKCYTMQENCEDCRDRPFDDVGLTHFTNCQKPWTCQSFGGKAKQNRLCSELSHAWFKARSEMEASWGRSARGPGRNNVNFGYCKRSGAGGYVPIERPFQSPFAVAVI